MHIVSGEEGPIKGMKTKSGKFFLLVRCSNLVRNIIALPFCSLSLKEKEGPCGK